MYQPGSHMRKVTRDFTVLLRCMTSIFFARTIQPFLSLVDREVEFLCTNNLIVIYLLGIIYLFSIFIKKEKEKETKRKNILIEGIELTTHLPYITYLSSELRGHVRMTFSVFFPFILNIKFVGRTSRGHSEGRSQDFSSTFLLRCVP